MHPQLFLKTFWRMDLQSYVFVAMSFAEQYNSRFKYIIEPAISSIEIDGTALKPYRVDLSKTGDSILTDIMDGIAHCQVVLADVSTIGKDSVTGQSYRNGNVMYEVGLALSCRHSSEVLLIRDDRDRFLFDVSTIPHMTIDFSDRKSAIDALRFELKERINERKYINDARTQLAIASISNEEARLLKYIADSPPGNVWGRPDGEMIDLLGMASTTRLLDKGIIKLVGQFEEGHPAYQTTPFGNVIAKLVKSNLRKYKSKTEISELEQNGAISIKFNSCPYCGRSISESFSSMWFPIYQCLSCGTKYCENDGPPCPDCNSSKYGEYGKVQK